MPGLFSSRSSSKRRSNSQGRLSMSPRSSTAKIGTSQRSKSRHSSFNNRPKTTNVGALQSEQAKPSPGNKVESIAETPVRRVANGRNNNNVASVSTPDTVAEEMYGSFWHEWVSRQKWDRVREKLKECTEHVESNEKKKRKKYLRRGKKITLVVDDIASQDANGETAIHVGLHEVDIPSDVLLGMIQACPKACKVADRNGYIPLHLAAKEGHRMKAIAEICLANPKGLATQDNYGLTALDHAVEVAKQLQKKSNIPQKHRAWECIADGEAERKADMLLWQEQQNKRWAVVKWLLLSSSVNPISSFSIGEKQPLLLDALIHSAPPSVVSLLTAASASFFKDADQGVSFACSAMYLCISRRYPPLILKNVAEQSPPETKTVKDETGMGLLSAQHIIGTMEQDERSRWVPRSSSVSTLKKCIKDKSLARADDSFLEWWIKMKFLIKFCRQTGSSKNEKDDYLLHAAISNADTPSAVIKLLLALYPGSALIPDPACNALPLHLHCMAGTYIKRHYEPSEEGMRTKMEMLVKANPDAVSSRFFGQTPLHLALDAGKTWYEVKALTSANRRLLRRRDPNTKLYPFQMAAMKRVLTVDNKARLAFQARNKYSDEKWQSLKSKSKLQTLKKVQREEDIEQLQTVFEFLRRYPNAVKSGIEKPKPPKLHEARDEHGMGIIATHYLSWAYANEDENHRPLVDNIRTLAIAIKLGKDGKILPKFDEWWNKMKFWIWYCYQGEVGSIPKEGTLVMPKNYDFMVHAAVSNSDTPPQIVHLLLELYNGSIQMPLPQTNMYALHIGASTTTYTPREFELPYINTMDLLVRAFPEAAKIRCNGKLPLHMGIEAGKTWPQLKRLVEVDNETLLERDFELGLYPFQMMALDRVYSAELRVRFQHLTRNRVGEKKWKKMKKNNRSKEIHRTQKRHELSLLSTIFELLRHCPAALEASISLQQEEKEARQSVGAILDPEGEQTESQKITIADSGTFDFEEAEYPDDEHRQDKAHAFTSFHKMSRISELDCYLDEKSEAMGKEECKDFAANDSVLRGELLIDDDDDDESDMWTYVSKLTQNSSHLAEPEDNISMHENSSKKVEEVFVVNENEEGAISDALVMEPEPSIEDDRSFAEITTEVIGECQFCDGHLGEQEIEEQGVLSESLLIPDVATEITFDDDAACGPQAEPEACKEIAEAFEKLNHIEPGVKLAPSTESLSKQRAESSPKLGNLKSSPSRRVVKASPAADRIAEAPSHLNHVEQPVEHQGTKPATPDRATMKIREASSCLKKGTKTKKNQISSIKVATKSHNDIIAQQERLGTYRSGWSNTPAIQRRRQQNRFGMINENKEKFLPCMLCSSGKREVLMLPCRHLCLCPRCSVTQKVAKCPTCSMEVESTMAVYL